MTSSAIHVVHDERAAAFVALGLGLDGTPAVLLCTSGTAAANFHPAVVEAGLSEVPMVIVTADRPPELRGVGAPQTIDQTNLFGGSVRWFHDPGVPDAAASSELALACPQGDRVDRVGTDPPQPPIPRAVARRSRRACPAPSRFRRPRPAPFARTIGVLIGSRPLLESGCGVILAGGRSGVRPDEVVALAASTGWPVLADPLSGCRGLDAAVTAFDALLRHERFATEHRPEIVVRIGRPRRRRYSPRGLRRAAHRSCRSADPG